jgi:Fe-S-cluster containining protein
MTAEIVKATQRVSCGLCRACCSYLTIPAPEEPEENRKVKTWISSGKEEKPAGVPCPQLNPNKMKFGCSIHSNPDKPSVCSTYLCAYAIGHLGNDLKHRPDNLGIMADIYEGKIRIIEIEKKALERQITKRIIWGLMEAAKQNNDYEWILEIHPLELMGTKMGTQMPIISAEKLSIGGKK